MIDFHQLQGRSIITTIIYPGFRSTQHKHNGRPLPNVTQLVPPQSAWQHERRDITRVPETWRRRTGSSVRQHSDRGEGRGCQGPNTPRRAPRPPRMHRHARSP